MRARVSSQKERLICTRGSTEGELQSAKNEKLFGKTLALREVLQMAVRRLSPGDHQLGDAAAEITVLRQVAEKVTIGDARTEILKAIAVLRDRVGR
jgi:hypothetical protein